MKMSSTTTMRNNDAFQSFIHETEEEEEYEELNLSRSSFVPRQISFSQDGATFGEIILVLLPYLILIFDIFLYFVLRGFQLTSYDQSLLKPSKS